MANWTALITEIETYIKQNGNKAITGDMLQGVLTSMVNALGGDGQGIDYLLRLLYQESSDRANADSTLQENVGTLTTAVSTLAQFINSGYMFRGVCDASTQPSPLNGKLFFLTSSAGQYSNMGNITVRQGISVIFYDGSTWSVKLLVGIDSTPTNLSENLVRSGGVYTSLTQENARAIAAETSSAEFNSTTKKLIFKNSAGTVLYEMDATAFIIDGMVDNVYISGGNLIISFNTDAGKQDISIPLTAIFNPANYYDKTAVDALLLPITTRLAAGYIYMGLAIPSGTPDTSVGKVFYLTATAGTYTNYGNLTVNAGITILSYNGSVWSADLLVAIDSTPTQNSNALVTSGGVQNELALGAVYDVSAKNPTAGINNDGKWESLSALLSDANLNTLIPTSVRKGGMSIKFVCSSDNKYVQFRLMSDSFNTTIANWQGVDEIPTADSDNLVKSGGVYSGIVKSFIDNKVLNKTQTKSLNASSSTASYYYLDFSLVKNTNDIAVIKISNSVGTGYNTPIEVRLNNNVVTSFMLKKGRTESYFIIPSNIIFDSIKLKLDLRDNNGTQWTIDVYNPTKEIYDVSKKLPTSGINGSNKYDLYSAVRAVPSELRHGGFVMKFIDVNLNKYVTYCLPSDVYNTVIERWVTIDYIEYENEANIEIRNAGKCNLHSEVFEIGSTNSSGNLNNSTNAIRSKIVYNVAGGKSVNISGLDGTYGVIWYNYSLGFLSFSNFVSTSLNVPTGACFARLVLKKTNVSEATPSIADGVIFIIDGILDTTIYDVSANQINASTNNNKFTLQDVLDYIPSEYQKAGVKIRFIDSDTNNYVEYLFALRNAYQKNPRWWVTNSFDTLQNEANNDILISGSHSFVKEEFELGSKNNGGYFKPSTNIVRSKIFYNVLKASRIVVTASESIKMGVIFYDAKYSIISDTPIEQVANNAISVPSDACFVKLFLAKTSGDDINIDFVEGMSVSVKEYGVLDSIGKKLDKNLVNEANTTITNNVMRIGQFMTEFGNSLSFSSEIRNTLVNLQQQGDKLNHVPVITIHNDIAYIVYMYNDNAASEDPTHGGQRVWIQPISDLKAGGNNYTIIQTSDFVNGENMELLDGTSVLSRSYDGQIVVADGKVILLSSRNEINGSESYVGYNIYNTETGLFEGWKTCKIKKDNVSYDLSKSNMISLYPSYYNNDIVFLYIANKPTIYNGNYYACLGAFIPGHECIVKSADMITFELEKHIEFDDINSECGVCFYYNKFYVICRRKSGSQSTRLIRYSQSWNMEEDILLQDAIPMNNGGTMISRSVLFIYNDKLYAATSLYDRSNMQIIEVNRYRLCNSVPVQQYIFADSGVYCNNMSFATDSDNNLYIAFTNVQLNPDGDGSKNLASVSKISIRKYGESEIMYKFKQLLEI